MTRKTELKYLRRQSDRDGHTMHFVIDSTTRRRPPSFVDYEDVDRPELGSGWFECERFKKGPWMKWRALRRVEKPSWAK